MTAATVQAQLERMLDPGHPDTIDVPALIRGHLVFPGDDDPHTDGVQSLRRPLVDRQRFTPTGEHQTIRLPRPRPRALLETDSGLLARGLHALTIRDVQDYVAALRRELLSAQDAVQAIVEQVNAVSLLDDRVLGMFFHQLPYLLDPDGLLEVVDRELGTEGVPGHAFLDGWVDVDAETFEGATARMARRAFPGSADAAVRPQVRALPTRQLHITAGNAPLIPVLSFLRAVATKGAAVVKSPADATVVSAVLAAGMIAVDPEHPITRHTSLVYWPGGDRAVENVLFGPNAFDRVIVWGSPDTVESVRTRAVHAKTVFLNPRYSVSLIGRSALGDGVEDVANRASIDTMIGNQQECVSSLVHYVEGDEPEVLHYCEALQAALRRWDDVLPHAIPRATLGRLRMLQRGELLDGRWFTNGSGPHITSAVVYLADRFDLSAHPLSRLVIVRRVDDLADVAPTLTSAVSAAGVYPADALAAHRDAIAAAGVSSIFPLGQCERTYAGMPHDGMRILSELVNWTNSSR